MEAPFLECSLLNALCKVLYSVHTTPLGLGATANLIGLMKKRRLGEDKVGPRLTSTCHRACQVSCTLGAAPVRREFPIAPHLPCAAAGGPAQSPLLHFWEFWQLEISHRRNTYTTETSESTN